MTKKVTVSLLVLGIVYCFLCFFILGIIIQNVMIFMRAGHITLSKKILIDTLVLSGIAGITAGVGSWLFAKLDERKARKSPHQIQNSDRKLPTTTPGALVL
ncbi:hypothetical protein QCD57_003389 [Enterobacter hormaechei]|nr:hypothetical protein [Enterobacter hormaechei]